MAWYQAHNLKGRRVCDQTTYHRYNADKHEHSAGQPRESTPEETADRAGECKHRPNRSADPATGKKMQTGQKRADRAEEGRPGRPGVKGRPGAMVRRYESLSEKR